MRRITKIIQPIMSFLILLIIFFLELNFGLTLYSEIQKNDIFKPLCILLYILYIGLPFSITALLCSIIYKQRYYYKLLHHVIVIISNFIFIYIFNILLEVDYGFNVLFAWFYYIWINMLLLVQLIYFVLKIIKLKHQQVSND